MKRSGVRVVPCLLLLPVLSYALAADGGPGATFSEFSVELFESETEGPVGRECGFVVAGHFRLGGRSDGIDLLSDDVTLLIGRSVLTISGGSLRLGGTSYSWSGTIDDTPVGVAMDDHGDGAYSFSVVAGSIEPVEGEQVPTMIIVGNDGGSGLARLDGERRLAERRGSGRRVGFP